MWNWKSKSLKELKNLQVSEKAQICIFLILKMNFSRNAQFEVNCSEKVDVSGNCKIYVFCFPGQNAEVPGRNKMVQTGVLHLIPRGNKEKYNKKEKSCERCFEKGKKP